MAANASAAADSHTEIDIRQLQGRPFPDPAVRVVADGAAGRANLGLGLRGRHRRPAGG